MRTGPYILRVSTEGRFWFSERKVTDGQELDRLTETIQELAPEATIQVLDLALLKEKDVTPHVTIGKGAPEGAPAPVLEEA